MTAAALTALALLLARPFAAPGQGKPDTDDDTLRYYLSKADAVVVGKVTDGLQRLGVDFEPIPVSVIGFQVKVIKSIKGKVAAKQAIMVTVTRAHDIGTSAPPNQGEEFVLFLKSSGDAWVSADKWFGMRPYSRTFVAHLERVKSQGKAPAKAR
ncbi:MAG: hypothetical protein U0797_03850 [Gemmataceae bacterium]